MSLLNKLQKYFILEVASVSVPDKTQGHRLNDSIPSAFLILERVIFFLKHNSRAPVI